MRNSRFIKVASATSATIALLAGTALAPAFAADDATAQVVSAAAVSVGIPINLPNGVLVQTSPTATVVDDGTAEGYITVAPEDVQGLTPELKSGKTQLNVGDTDSFFVDIAKGGSTVSALQEPASIVGSWTVSNPSVLNVGTDNTVIASAPGTATLTFTPTSVSGEAVSADARPLTVEVTVIAEVEETPAPVETAVSAPAESETPAPVVTEAPAPVATETSAPVETEVSAPAATEVPVAAVPEAPVAAAPAAEAPAPSSTSLYENCADVHAQVGHSLHDGDAGYEAKLDRDGDGEACELNPDYENADSALTEDGTYASHNPANGTYYVNDSYSAESNRETLANTGFGSLGIFAGGMTLLGAGATAVIVSRRKSQA